MYLPLYKAAREGDWDLFQGYKEDVTAIISSDSETALHVAVLSGKANDFVKKMVELMPRHALALKDSYGETALHNAAMIGNTEAARVLVDKNTELLYIINKDSELPILRAALNCQKETLEYLISVTEPGMENSPFKGQSGVDLLLAVITSGFFDVALDLVDKYPHLAQLDDDDGLCALSAIAVMRSVFRCEESFSWWQNFIYHRILPKQYECKAIRDSSLVGDIENRSCDAPASNNSCSLFQIIKGGKQCDKIISVPQVKEVRKKSERHKQAVQLVNMLCREMLSLPEEKASAMFLGSILRAAENGISEIVVVIMEMYPLVALASEDETGKDVFLLAATNRYENVFNLLYMLPDRQYQVYDGQDSHGNNLMHICGKLAPLDRLNLVPGAALQMQRELQWFKEMEKSVHPSRRTWKNEENLTPKMMFTREHRQLKEEGEKWMKETATACNIAAALIATVMFAAAFTVPGGVKSDGTPVFLDEFAFHVFAVSDAISLFTSITSLLMFLSMLTSRYAEEDFLYVLPKRLTLGLLSLFVSITFMLAAFCAAMFLVFRDKLAWILIPVAAFASLPVASFVLLQFPLLVEVVYSTYGPGIFGKKR
ncbi:hypothetical protein C2S52_019062 [Perilla frutescens var. hirtella]|nr:hypothetical protein C2S52_019062 [Perilla frutescens var. hirtella]